VRRWERKEVGRKKREEGERGEQFYYRQCKLYG